MKTNKIAVSDYQTGDEIWRGDMRIETWIKYQDTCNDDSGACEPAAFLTVQEMDTIGITDAHRSVFCEVI